MGMHLSFGAMVATSTLVMFGLMYLNTYRLAHVTLSDPRVRELADGIIQSQRREIDEMKALVNDIRAHGEKPAHGAGTAGATSSATAAPQHPDATQTLPGPQVPPAGPEDARDLARGPGRRPTHRPARGDGRAGLRKRNTRGGRGCSCEVS